jgi:hypothetical protein
MKKTIVLSIAAFALVNSQAFNEEACHSSCRESCIHKITKAEEASFFTEASCYSECALKKCVAPAALLANSGVAESLMSNTESNQSLMTYSKAA